MKILPSDIAEMVEMERPARRVGQRHRPQCLDKRSLSSVLPPVFSSAAFDDHAIDVKAGGGDARERPS